MSERTLNQWNLHIALEHFREMSPMFHAWGYLLSIYGSVLFHKSARDLDLIAVPWRPAPLPPSMAFDEVCRQFGLVADNSAPYSGLMKTWSKTARDRDGRIFDFQFRRSESTMEEAFEFSMALQGKSEVRREKP